MSTRRVGVACYQVMLADALPAALADALPTAADLEAGMPPDDAAHDE